MTYEEVDTWAKGHEATFGGGVSVVLDGNFSGTQTITHESGSSVGESITVTFPGTGFELSPHR